jgi:hypothetical protein
MPQEEGTVTYTPFILENLLHSLQDSLAVLSPELVPIHERLVVIRRQLVALAAKGGQNARAELKPFQEELRNIDSLSNPLLTVLRAASLTQVKRIG